MIQIRVDADGSVRPVAHHVCAWLIMQDYGEALRGWGRCWALHDATSYDLSGSPGCVVWLERSWSDYLKCSSELHASQAKQRRWEALKVAVRWRGRTRKAPACPRPETNFDRKGR